MRMFRYVFHEVNSRPNGFSLSPHCPALFRLTPRTLPLPCLASPRIASPHSTSPRLTLPRPAMPSPLAIPGPPPHAAPRPRLPRVASPWPG
jgi:hypothetical protein